MTVKAALAAIRRTGCTARYLDGEFRVRLPDAKPGEGYFTNDATDAVHTAFALVTDHAYHLATRVMVGHD